MYQNPLFNEKEKRDPASMSEIVVTNLNFRTTIDQIAHAFSPFGEFEQCRLMLTERSESRCFAFIKYKLPQSAQRAIQEMNEFSMLGRRIEVAWAVGKNEDKSQLPDPQIRDNLYRTNYFSY